MASVEFKIGDLKGVSRPDNDLSRMLSATKPVRQKKWPMRRLMAAGVSVLRGCSDEDGRNAQRKDPDRLA